jgi:hypothetical protein
VSFLRTLLGEKQVEPARVLYFVWREGGPAHGGKTIEALIRGEWKLVQDSPFGPRELYNLQADPGETKNLAAKEPAVVHQLEAALREHIQRGGQVPWQGPDHSPVGE